MKQFGLIGKELTHSFSKSFFTKKFQEANINAEYNLYPIPDIKLIRDLVLEHSLSGFNVTIPYKESIIPFLSELSKEASAVQAVNCVILKNETWIGYNTDIIGFNQSLTKWLLPANCKAIILGSGGASKAAQYVLKNLHIPFVVLSRNQHANYITYEEADASLFKSHKLIINTTPLGMHPHIDVAPSIPYEYIQPSHFCYDMIYNPSETKFLQLCKQQGASIQNGLDMLHMQAEESFKLFFP